MSITYPANPNPLTKQQRFAKLKAKANQASQPTMKIRTVLIFLHPDDLGAGWVMRDTITLIDNPKPWVEGLIADNYIKAIPAWYMVMTFNDMLTVEKIQMLEVVQHANGVTVYERAPGVSAPTAINLSTWPPKVKS